jgi:sporulation protein YlmC with PRC-barrel domain
MKAGDPLKLASELLDLPILDKHGRYCGIVDDLELSGGAGEQLRLKALLVGPGAYRGRLPGWAFRLATAIAGDRMVRVPADDIDDIHTMVRLRSSAEDARLGVVERKVRRWIPRGGAL